MLLKYPNATNSSYSFLSFFLYSIIPILLFSLIISFALFTTITFFSAFFIFYFLTLCYSLPLSFSLIILFSLFLYCHSLSLFFIIPSFPFSIILSFSVFLSTCGNDSLTSALLAQARSNKQRNEYFIAMLGRHVGATFAERRFIIPGAAPMIRGTKQSILQITMKT